MDRLDRIFHLYQVLRDRRGPVPGAELMERLECSQATLSRDIAFLRDMLDAPIETIREQGYWLDATQGFELPGLWFSADELRALLTVQALLRELGQGLLDEHIRPLSAQIDQLLEKAARGVSPGEISRRLHFLPIFQRASSNLPVFTTVAGATFDRTRLQLSYHGRARDRLDERLVSPQRLTHYRGNWYLDAWCHERDGLRRFSLDRIRQATRHPQPACECDPSELEQLDRGFGIFTGHTQRKAELLFSPERARWVADEQWHSDQIGRHEPDGHYRLILPYSDSRELIGDILRHGVQVEVLGPPELRFEVETEIHRMAAKYSGSEDWQ
ncbi:MAG TPA: YafY family protein [Guyparkeria sp.]|nr:YafY family protein [Guyparkeria sp.]